MNWSLILHFLNKTLEKDFFHLQMWMVKNILIYIPHALELQILQKNKIKWNIISFLIPGLYIQFTKFWLVNHSLPVKISSLPKHSATWKILSILWMWGYCWLVYYVLLFSFSRWKRLFSTRIHDRLLTGCIDHGCIKLTDKLLSCVLAFVNMLNWCLKPQNSIIEK